MYSISTDGFVNVRKTPNASSKIIGVMRKLWGGKSRSYSSMFSEASDKSELVATFLAILELIKGKRVRIDGDGENAELKLISGGGKRWKEEN